MRGRIMAFAICLGAMVSLAAGCYDYKDLREQSYISLVAIDKGKDKPYKLTLQAPKVKAPGEGGGGGGPAFDVLSQEGSSISECLNNVGNYFGKTPNLAHIRMIIIGAGIAKEGILSDLASMTLRSPQMRVSTLVAVTPGEASKLVEAPPGQEDSPSAYYTKFLRKTQNTSVSYPSSMLDVMTSGRLGSPNTPVIARVTEKMGAGPNEGKPIGLEASGTGLFDDGHLKGWMDDYETQGWLILTGRMKSASVPIDLDGGRVVTVVREVGVTVDVGDGGGSPSDGVRITCDVDTDADITEVIGNGNTYITAEGLHRLDTMLAENLRKRCEAALAKSRKLGIEPFNFVSYVRARTPYHRFGRLDWRKAYLKSRVDVNVTANIRRSGGIFRNPDPKGRPKRGQAY